MESIQLPIFTVAENNFFFVKLLIYPSNINVQTVLMCWSPWSMHLVWS